jgi:cytochrome c556
MSGAVIVSIVWWGGLIAAQKPTSTPEELDKAMKRAKPAMDAAAKAVDGKAFAAANKQLDAIKQVMTDTQAFWVLYKKDDAVKANKDVIAKIVEVQTRFAATPPLRPDAARSALKYIEAACKVCHDKYRIRDADNNWILKPGTVKLTP